MISTSKTCEGAGEWLTDADLRRHEVKLAPPPRPAAFVPAFPLAVLQAVAQARAEKALPLILAIHRQLQMSSREWTPINAAVWTAAGRPAEKHRAAILRKLKGLS